MSLAELIIGNEVVFLSCVPNLNKEVLSNGSKTFWFGTKVSPLAFNSLSSTYFFINNFC